MSDKKGGADEDDSDDDEDEDDSDEETPKKEKRGSADRYKTPVSTKKAKADTFQTDGKKGGHVATPYPSKQGVEEIEIDRATDKVTVKEEKVDPVKILERIQKRYSRNVELLHPKTKVVEKNKTCKEKMSSIFTRSLSNL
ncbi:hypothetical protein QYF36_012880 [Acer negundo]|nr:hypothetical protein QYF36_012880 [Acer negundo]